MAVPSQERVHAHCILGPDHIFPVTITSLSPSGVEASSPHALEAGRVVSLRLSTESPSVVLNLLIMGSISGCREEDGAHRLSVKFVHTERRDLERLVRFFFDEFDIQMDEDKRQAPRVPQQQGCCYVSERGEEVEATMRDVSMTGLGLRSKEALRPGYWTIFRFPGPYGNSVEAVGTAVWCRPAGDDAWDMGVRFDAMSDATRDGLIRAISRMFSEV